MKTLPKPVMVDVGNKIVELEAEVKRLTQVSNYYFETQKSLRDLVREAGEHFDVLAATILNPTAEQNHELSLIASWLEKAKEVLGS